MIVEISNSGQGRADKVCSIRLVVVALSADAIEELASQRQVGHEVQVVHSLEIVDQSQDIPMPHRYAFQNSDFIPDHVLSSGHKPLVDDLGSIVSPRVDVHTLFDHRVASSTQCLSGLVATWLHLRLRLRCGSSVRGHVCGGRGSSCVWMYLRSSRGKRRVGPLGQKEGAMKSKMGPDVSASGNRQS